MSPGRGVYDLANKLGHIFGLGRVYLTRNKGTGLPALMEVPTGACPHRVPDGAVQAMVTAYPGPSPMTTVELRAGRPEHLANVLDLGASLAEGALCEPRARAHLSSGKALYSRPMPPPVVTTKPSRASSWPTGLAAAGILAALLVPDTVDHTEPHEPILIRYTSPAVGAEGSYMADIVEFRSEFGMGEKPLCVRVPDGPMPGQDTPPCRSPARSLKGGCWTELAAKPSPCCPENTAEYKGSCYFGLRGGLPMNLPKGVRIRGTP